jgi:serine/threonine-protein kinase
MSLERLRASLSDRYRIERELGHGGMATVYLAHDIKHDRKVAIKVLREEISAAVGAERFLSEIKTTANLQHPHILALFDSGAVNTTHDSRLTTHLYYVMPFIDGESLRDRLDREKQLSVDDSMRLVREVGDALDYAHRAGVVHRDIKPENILLSGGHAIVADFGIARAVTASENARLTQTGQVVGTPAYLSPEQVTGEDLDGRSDLYSLGCVLYECLTGELPFNGPAMAMLAQRVISPPPSARKKRNDIPVHLDQVLSRAMATQSTDRFATCSDLIAAFNSQVAIKPANQNSIVVLPFVNQSPDPDNEFFSDGLTEEIISDLAAIKSLQVISRTSAMQLKGTTKDVRTIGHELGVRYILEGSVRKAGNSLRITAQLIDAASDSQLWSAKYSGTMDDVFELQERVAREIVKALGITLTSDEDRRLAHRAIEDARAFELYLQARQEVRRYGVASLERADSLTRRAIEIEGETAPLQALLAWVKVARVRAGFAESLEPLDEAATVAARLLKNPTDAHYGHALLGIICYERGQTASAIGHLNAALEREPNDADSLFYAGICNQAAGQIATAEAIAERLSASDPLSPMALIFAGLITWWSNRAPDGIASIERAVEIDPGNLIVRWTLGYGYTLVGNIDGAAKQANHLLEHAPTMPYTNQLMALVHGMRGRPYLARTALGDVQGLDPHHKFHLAESFAMAEEPERALALLEEAVTGFHPAAFIAEYCPFFESLRGTPRFAAIVAEAKQRTADFKVDKVTT